MLSFDLFPFEINIMGSKMGEGWSAFSNQDD